MACSRRLEYGDSDFDLFAAQVPSPLFQRMGTTLVAAQAYGDSDFDFFAARLPSPLFQMMGTAYLGVLDAREYAAAASEASALESPNTSPVRIKEEKHTIVLKSPDINHNKSTSNSS